MTVFDDYRNISLKDLGYSFAGDRCADRLTVFRVSWPYQMPDTEGGETEMVKVNFKATAFVSRKLLTQYIKIHLITSSS